MDSCLARQQRRYHWSTITFLNSMWGRFGYWYEYRSNTVIHETILISCDGNSTGVVRMRWQQELNYDRSRNHHLSNNGQRGGWCDAAVYGNSDRFHQYGGYMASERCNRRRRHQRHSQHDGSLHGAQRSAKQHNRRSYGNRAGRYDQDGRGDRDAHSARSNHHDFAAQRNPGGGSATAIHCRCHRDRQQR